MVFPRNKHPAVSHCSYENVGETPQSSGNPLEPKLLLVLWKRLTIGTVMTSLIVKTFRIGQSVGKASTSVMTRIGRSFNDVSLERFPLCFANKGEIARVLVHIEGLVHRSELKVQSGSW